MFQSFQRISKHPYYVQNFFKSCRLEIMRKKHGRARQATDDNVMQRVRIKCWIIKAINTPSEYVIRIAFPLQQYLHEHRLDVTL
jgi:hypothetical protein